MDGFEVVFDDVGVDLAGLDVAVAEHFLDVADAGSAAQHAGGAGMPVAQAWRRLCVVVLAGRFWALA